MLIKAICSIYDQLIAKVIAFNPQWGSIAKISTRGYAPKTISLFISFMFMRLFLYSDFQLLWIVFFGLLLLYHKEIAACPALWLAIFILAGLAIVFLVMMSAEFYPFLIDGTTIGRLLMHISLLAFFWSAIVILTYVI